MPEFSLREMFTGTSTHGVVGVMQVDGDAGDTVVVADSSANVATMVCAAVTLLNV
jgi:hypothetical protein